MNANDQILVPLSRLRPARVEWLWRGRLAAGTVALLDGDPGQGKSLLTLDLAARLSAGRSLPDDCPPAGPVPVILLNSEDSVPRTVIPRLQAAGADLDRIHVFQARSADGRPRPPSFPADCDLLARTIRESAARLVVVDPFFAFLSVAAFSLNDQLVRKALTPLVGVVEETGVTVVLVRHLTKIAAGRRALQRGIGAIAVIGAARTAFLAAAHPDEPDLHALAATKNNLGPLAPTLAYRIASDPAGSPVIDWVDPLPLGADALAGAAARPGRGEALGEAMAFLRDVLRLGPATRETVLRQSRALNLSDRTVKRAKIELGVLSKQRREEDRNVWYWSLSDDDGDSDRIMRDLYREDAELRRQAQGPEDSGEPAA